MCLSEKSLAGFFFLMQYAHSGSSMPANCPSQLTRSQRSLNMTLAVKASATQQNALGTNAATTAALALIFTLGLLESTAPTGLNVPTVTAPSLLDTTTALLPHIGRMAKSFNSLRTN